MSCGILNRGLVLLCGVFLCSGRGVAGFLLTAGPSWNNYVFEAESSEDTPNYYGYGGRVGWGYSVAQIVDIGLYAQYIPGRLNTAIPPRTDTVLMDYGAEVGVRFMQALYLGIRGGIWKYQLFRAYRDDEVRGSWLGLGATGALGLIWPVNKKVSWQTNFEFGRAVLQGPKVDPESSVGRQKKMSRIGVSVSFVYNDDDVLSLGRSLYNSFF
jgi:hypothetical protein